MTMSDAIIDRLEMRGLDAELAINMGWESTRRDGRELVVIPFFRDDRILRRKVRSLSGEPKIFSQMEQDAEQIVWNENALRDASLAERPLVITEGELDAMVAIQCGFPRTISVPNGAPPPRDGDDGPLQDVARYEWVKALKPLLSREHVKEIVLAVDNDPPGVQLLHDLSHLMERLRCKFLTYPAGCKDLNDVLKAHGQKGVVEIINGARWIKVAGVYKLSELPPLPAPLTFDIGFDTLNENYKMRMGDLAVITGVPGLGKTTFCNDLCCRVARNHNLKIAWASFEQTPQRDHRRALRSWYWSQAPFSLCADQTLEADAWIEEHHMFIVPQEGDEVTLDWLLDRMEVAAVQERANVIVIDPWNEMDHLPEEGESETQYVGRAIKTFRRFARRLQVHLIIVAHPAKLQKVEGKYKPPTLYEISGSANWYNKCDIGIIVHRETPEFTDVKVQKSRYHDEIGKPGEVRMRYERDTRHFVDESRLA